jgi:GNAT superfamily N-acetyltransferase
MNVYFVANVRSILLESLAVPNGAQVRPISETDLPALADLYVQAYHLGPDALGIAVAEMESAFDGTWGTLWIDASPVAWLGTEPVAVVLTVRRPTMKDAPDCPWLIEVFTHPRHRRAALARTLLGAAGTVIAGGGEDRVGLTVDDDNVPALTLYRSLGFVETG